MTVVMVINFALKLASMFLLLQLAGDR